MNSTLKKTKNIPFKFVLDELDNLNPILKPMFGCWAIYLGEKIVLILRQRKEHPTDNGIWVCTLAEHHKSLKSELKSMRSIKLFGPGPTGWQNLPVKSKFFEQDVQRVMELVKSNDPRIGKIPKRKPAKKRSLKKK
jgi:DNA-directed RNA polymerase specialized sigma54-like protein